MSLVMIMQLFIITHFYLASLIRHFYYGDAKLQLILIYKCSVLNRLHITGLLTSDLSQITYASVSLQVYQALSVVVCHFILLAFSVSSDQLKVPWRDDIKVNISADNL